MGQTRVLANGARADVQTGVIVAGAPLDSTQARAMARARWDKAQEAAAAGLLAGVTNSGVMAIDPRAVPVDAWGCLIARGTEMAMQADNLRGVTEWARFAGQSAGMLARDKDDQPAPGITRLDIPTDALVKLAEALAGRRTDE